MTTADQGPDHVIGPLPDDVRTDPVSWLEVAYWTAWVTTAFVLLYMTWLLGLLAWRAGA